ncbi:hypothetical protein [Allosphingosinicella deserti]|uniref:SMI1/KNR4 family protein n=1 Tax=Allosphingosinicella deserti TaxID=2116704 RepID=A0A2P7QFQ9_9SPHN|nr:hypothetical protein [Sphingomonas deserti]PSJ36818.1 hypothetical protein C7I55_24195 [Sphingomonas deserti]
MMTGNAIGRFMDTARRAGIAFEATLPSVIADKDAIDRLFGQDIAEAIQQCGYPGGVEVPGIAEDLLIYPLEEIAARQEGYRSGAGEEQWDKDHWVFADRSADPFTVGTGGRIFFSRHGQGAWSYEYLCANLLVFFDLASAWIEFFVIDNQSQIVDDDFSVLPQKRAEFEARVGALGGEIDREAAVPVMLGDWSRLVRPPPRGAVVRPAPTFCCKRISGRWRTNAAGR